MDENFRMFTFRIDEKQKERIKKAAEELELNPSEFARQLVLSVTDAVITTDVVDNPKALRYKFQVLADYFITLRMAKDAREKLRGYETEQETEQET